MTCDLEVNIGGELSGGGGCCWRRCRRPNDGRSGNTSFCRWNHIHISATNSLPETATTTTRSHVDVRRWYIKLAAGRVVVYILLTSDQVSSASNIGERWARPTWPLVPDTAPVQRVDKPIQTHCRLHAATFSISVRYAPTEYDAEWPAVPRQYRHFTRRRLEKKVLRIGGASTSPLAVHVLYYTLGNLALLIQVDGVIW